MAYIFIQGDRAVYPFDLAQLKVEFPQVSFAQTVLAGVFPDRLAEWGVYPVEPADRPVDAIITDIEEGPPELADGVWTQQWLVTTAQPAAVSARLASLRAAAVAEVNQGAGAFRQRFITDIPGQQATYLGKEQEALAWTEGANPDDFPYLANEAAATGQEIGDVVALILATATTWRALDAKVEGKRRGAAVAIAAAETEEDVNTAKAVDWDALLA
jgi:hypothetical protein